MDSGGAAFAGSDDGRDAAVDVVDDDVAVADGCGVDDVDGVDAAGDESVSVRSRWDCSPGSVSGLAK